MAPSSRGGCGLQDASYPHGGLMVTCLVQMYPTLLGVRLLNDLSRGTQPCAYHDRFEWAAVPPSRHTPHVKGVTPTYYAILITPVLHWQYR